MYRIIVSVCFVYCRPELDFKDGEFVQKGIKSRKHLCCFFIIRKKTIEGKDTKRDNNNKIVLFVVSI